MISFKVVIGVLFGLLVIAIAILAVFSYQDSENRVIAAGRVMNSHQVIAKTEEIYSAYRDMQLQASANVSLSDTSRAADYRAAKEKLQSSVDALWDLTADDHEERRIDSLDAAIRQFSHATDSLSVNIAGRRDAAKVFMTVTHWNLANRIELIIKSLKHAEEIILARRKVAWEESGVVFERTFILLIIAIAILLAVTFLTVRHNFNKRRAAEDEMKKALQAEIELNKLKSSFITLASHEFRTPLTTILSSAFLLEKYSFGENQRKAAKHLERIKSSVSNFTSMLDECLSVTRIEEGQVQLNLEKMDLPAYVGDICKDLQTLAKPGQTIHYSHSGVQEVKTDPVLFGNIVRNIVTNSIKYSPENTPIYVSSIVNSKIHVSVKDEGIGIPAADQKHLFERFYRASNAGSVQGTGLGLHIMKHYVQMLNGSVKLSSDVGKGTQVELTFNHASSD